MIQASLIFAARRRLDANAARRLVDYGDLDDAGVARALEQVHNQRWGTSELPGHLARIESLAVVRVSAAHAVTCRLWHVPPQSESDVLDALSGLVEPGLAEIIDWNGATRAWLIARAAAIGTGLPAPLAGAQCRALGELIAPMRPGHPADPAQIEAECRTLFDADCAGTAADLLDLAGARARLYWRVNRAEGQLERAEAQALAGRLDEALSAARRTG